MLFASRLPCAVKAKAVLPLLRPVWFGHLPTSPATKQSLDEGQIVQWGCVGFVLAERGAQRHERVSHLVPRGRQHKRQSSAVLLI